MEQDNTRVHEHYLRHLLLLGQAATLPLRSIVEKAVKKRGLKIVLSEAKFTFKALFSQQYLKLFPAGNVNTDLKSWDTRLLCTVICLLFASVLSDTACDAITCILEQVNDLNNYAASAALDYDTYETKWGCLHEALLHLLTTTDSNSKYKCTRLIQSFAKEPIQVNMILIDKLKETRDVDEQLDIVIKYHGSKIFDIDDETETEMKTGVQDEFSDKPELPTTFSAPLQDTNVYENENVVLTCEANNREKTVEWFKSSYRLVETENISFSHDGRRHCLEISAAGLQDTGLYSCQFTSGEAFTSACVHVKALPVSFTSTLHDMAVCENMRILLECDLDTDTKDVKWYKFSERLTQTDTILITHDRLHHSLEITAADVKDTGIYSCLSGGILTSAYVNVKESPAEFIECLSDTEVLEGVDISLSCKVNELRKTPVWSHDGKKIETSSVRQNIISNGNEHTLTILNAKLYDEGKYMIAFGNKSSEAILTVRELPTTFSAPLQDTNVYENENVVLTCEANNGEKTVEWFKSSYRLVETENISFSHDGRRHCLEISAAGLQDTGLYSCQFTSGEAFTSACVHVKALPVSFTSTLQDMAVCENMRILLECDLDTDTKEVKWYKFSERLTQTDTILITHDRLHHSLEITAADVKDTGIYSCLSGGILTSAYVNVKESPAEFIECLSDTEVLEGVDISLSCKVNKLRKTPVWSHDGKKIETSSVRQNIISNGNEHKLTILNAKLYDEGKYMIAFGNKSSEATLTVRENSNDLYKKQLTKQNYRNWVRGALGLLFLKQGLVEFSNKCICKQYGMFITNVPAPAVQCTHCSSDTLMPFNNHAGNKNCHKRNCLCSKKPKPPNKRVVCPNGGFCSKIYDLIVADHRNADPCLANTDIPAWSSDPWSIGTCFVNTPGYKRKISAHEIDCSGLLSIFINNRFFNTELGDVKINGKTDPFKQARDARNEILHNPNYELSESEFNLYIDLFKSVLEVENVLKKKHLLETEPHTAKALENLERLQNYQIDIDEEVNKTTKAIKDQTIIDSLGKAEKEKEEKIKKLKETLKDKEEQIKFLRQVRHYQPTEKTTMLEVVFHVQIVILGSSEVKQYNDKILEGMRSFLNTPHGTQSLEGTNLQQSYLDITVGKLLYSIVNLSGVYVSLADNSSLKVCVTSNDGLNEFITLMNGKLLQQNVYQVRKCIEKDIGETVVVETAITSESLTAARTQLSTKGILCNRHGDFKCNNHPWMQSTWYCVWHEEFCCSMCKNDEHGSCKGIRKVLSELSESEVEKDPLVVQQRKKYNIRKGSILNRDKETYFISGICVLPSGEILLADSNNQRLKKLNSSFKLMSHCDIPGFPEDVCFIGNDVAAVCLYYPGYAIQFVDVSGNMRLKHQIKLKIPCYRLTCHGDILYCASRDTVYTCKTDGSQEHVLYRLMDGISFIDTAVSDDGEKIYITPGNRTLEIIDNKGNHLSILKLHDISFKRVCTVGDGSVLACDIRGNSVLRVDVEGNRILGTVVSSSDLNGILLSMCFDRQHCRLIVGYDDCDKIEVFKFK